MSIQDVRVIWGPLGWEPIVSNKQDSDAYGDDLVAGIKAIEAEWQTPKRDKDLPWLRAGTGGGSALFDLHGIRVLQAAMGRNMLKV